MQWKLTDDRPIWMQLTEQLTERIVSGLYPLGSRMPSVRELAAQAGVNPNTMPARAGAARSRWAGRHQPHRGSHGHRRFPIG